MATLRQLRNGDEPARNGFDDYQSWIQMAGAQFPVSTSALLGSSPEALPTGDDFSAIYKSNGVVFACMAARQRL
jgi:hypothetical protein